MNEYPGTSISNQLAKGLTSRKTRDKLFDVLAYLRRVTGGGHQANQPDKHSRHGNNGQIYD